MASSSNIWFFVYIVKLVFSGTTFMNHPSQIFWITCCSFYISICFFTLYFYVLEMAAFLKPHEPTSASFKLFSCSFITSPRLHQIKELGSCSGLGFCLRECCSWFNVLCRQLKLPSYQQWGCSTSYHLYVHWSSTLISFKNFSFAFTTWLTVWHKTPSFQPILVFNNSSSPSLIISNF